MGNEDNSSAFILGQLAHGAEEHLFLPHRYPRGWLIQNKHFYFQIEKAKQLQLLSLAYREFAHLLLGWQSKMEAISQFLQPP